MSSRFRFTKIFCPRGVIDGEEHARSLSTKEIISSIVEKDLEREAIFLADDIINFSFAENSANRV